MYVVIKISRTSIVRWTAPDSLTHSLVEGSWTTLKFSKISHNSFTWLLSVSFRRIASHYL